MIGTEISATGGIATVVSDYYDFGIMARLGIEYKATYRDGTKLSIILFFIQQVPKILVAMLPVKIIHAQVALGGSFWRLSSLLYMAKVFGKKTVMHIHGSHFDIFYHESNSIGRAIIRNSLRRNDVVIALSKDWKERLLQIEPSANVIVLRNGISADRYKPSKARELHQPIRVVTLGELGQRKGTYDLIDAIELNADSGYEYVLAGNGEVDAVRNLIINKGLQEIVEVPGYVGAEKKKELLDSADLYVLPSYNEGLPISILEAMASALPIVSTPVGGIPEAVLNGETGFLVQPGDSVKIAEAIVSSTADPSDWRKMGEAGLALIEREFSLSIVERKLEKIYSLLDAPDPEIR